jgi:cytochrome c553
VKLWRSGAGLNGPRIAQAIAASLFLAAAVSASHIPSAPPRLLSETGLYAGRGTNVIDPRNRPFSPQYPLWSDGAEKSRWVRLPEGAAIDARNIDRWDFPGGTRFWKEFRFGGRKVETRFLRKNGDGSWTFASYAWNETQTDAILAPADGLPNVAEIAPGKFHSIPAVTDCRACHVPSEAASGEGASRTEILGFSALQLSTDRDPGAPHAEPLMDDMVTLSTLQEENLFEPARPEFVAAPPRIPAPDARTRSVLGYLSTNCGSCHNEDSSIANLGLALKAKASSVGTGADVGAGRLRRGFGAQGLSRLVGQQTSKWQIPHAPEGASRYVTPGAPDLSAILVRMKSRRPSTQMPPLGTVLHDKEAIALVTEWIDSLTALE